MDHEIFDLASPEETEALALRLGQAVGAGDVILLEGEIGAGKTHFARALVRARLAASGAPDEDIPSPTFTLVQTYRAGDLAIWHADLYRLSDPQEIEELGLLAAFDDALCLVEWPDRLGGLAPATALRLHLAIPSDVSDTRRITAKGPAHLVNALRQTR